MGKKEYDFPDYRFYRYTKTDIGHATFAEQLHLQRAEQENIPIQVGTLSFQDLERELAHQNIVLLRVNVKPLRQEQRNSSNFIVVYGSTQEHFQIIDPATGASCVPRQLLEEAFSSLGDKKYRDNRMIVFSGQGERRII